MKSMDTDVYVQQDMKANTVKILRVPEGHVTMVVTVSYQDLLGIVSVHPGTREHVVNTHHVHDGYVTTMVRAVSLVPVGDAVPSPGELLNAIQDNSEKKACGSIQEYMFILFHQTSYKQAYFLNIDG